MTKKRIPRPTFARKEYVFAHSRTRAFRKVCVFVFAQYLERRGWQAHRLRSRKRDGAPLLFCRRRSCESREKRNSRAPPLVSNRISVRQEIDVHLLWRNDIIRKRSVGARLRGRGAGKRCKRRISSYPVVEHMPRDHRLRRIMMWVPPVWQ